MPITFFGLGVIEQVERGVDAEGAAAAEDRVCLACHNPLLIFQFEGLRRLSATR